MPADSDEPGAPPSATPADADEPGAPPSATPADADEPGPHAFLGTVVVVEGGGWSHRVEVPADVAAALPVEDVTRVVGTIEGHRFRRQLHGRDATPFVAFGRTWLRRRELVPGEPLELTIAPDPDPDGVDLPDELEAALEADPLAEHAWELLTPGRRRSYAHHVDRAVRDETRARRVTRLLGQLHDGTA